MHACSGDRPKVKWMIGGTSELTGDYCIIVHMLVALKSRQHRTNTMEVFDGPSAESWENQQLLGTMPQGRASMSS